MRRQWWFGVLVGAAISCRPGAASSPAVIAAAAASARVSASGGASVRTLSVLFSPDEEKGSTGSRDAIGWLARSQDYVLSYEPPDGERVIVATNDIGQSSSS